MSSSPTDPADGLISIAAAAKAEGINKSTLSRQVKSGQVRSHGGKVRLSEVREDRAKNVRATSATAAPVEPAAASPEPMSTQPLHATPRATVRATKRATQRNHATDHATAQSDATSIGDAAARVVAEVGGWITLAAAARAAGVNKSTISRQVKSGAIRSQDGKVRLAEVLEDRAKNINLSKRRRAAQPTLPLPKAPDETPPTIEDLEADPDDLEVLVDGRVLKFADAQRLRETYVGKQRQLEFLEKVGKLVSREAAEAAFFDAAREARDAWMGWPARVVTLMASELGVEAASLSETLTRYVRQHLAELGDTAAPEFAAGH